MNYATRAISGLLTIFYTSAIIISMWKVVLVFKLMFLLLMTLPALCATYYVSPKGSDSSAGDITNPWLTVQHAADTAGSGDSVYIRGGTYSERVVVKNSGKPGSYIIFSAYEGETVTIDGADVAIDSGEGAYGKGLFDLSNRSYIKLSGLRIVNSASAAIYAKGADNIIIADNYTYNSVSSGIGIWSSTNVTIDGNEVELACNNGTQESITVAGTGYFDVFNNVVHDGGPGDHGGEGIDIKNGSHDGIVHGNRVYNINTLCIYIDAQDKHTYNIRVYANTALNCKTNGFALASEAGGLLENVSLYNNLSFNNTWYGIHIGHNDNANVSLQPLKNISIYNNTVYNSTFALEF